MATATSAPAQQQSSPAASLQLDLDSSPIPGQQAYVVLDLYGNLVKSSSSKSTESLLKDYSTLYQMLQETSAFSQTVKRISIMFDSSVQYIIARDDETHIYIVQTTIKGGGGGSSASSSSQHHH